MSDLPPPPPKPHRPTPRPPPPSWSKGRLDVIIAVAFATGELEPLWEPSPPIIDCDLTTEVCPSTTIDVDD